MCFVSLCDLKWSMIILFCWMLIWIICYFREHKKMVPFVTNTLNSNSLWSSYSLSFHIYIKILFNLRWCCMYSDIKQSMKSYLFIYSVCCGIIACKYRSSFITYQRCVISFAISIIGDDFCCCLCCCNYFLHMVYHFSLDQYHVYLSDSCPHCVTLEDSVCNDKKKRLVF